MFKTFSLSRLANSSEPFACKDIKIALTEIMELTNSLDQAKEKVLISCYVFFETCINNVQVREKETYISQIVEERNEFKRTLDQYVIKSNYFYMFL